MNKAEYLINISATGERSATSKIEGVQRKLDAADRSASRLSGRVGGLGNALRSLPGGEFFANPLVQLTAGIGVVSHLGMQAEKTATAFNVLVGSESEAAKMLGQLNEYADNTLWDRSSTQEAAKTMLGFGVSAESVTKDLKMLGDVAMGDKNKLQQLALVFGQISAAGKLQGQDLLQLINAGYNPLLDISALTGKSVAQLKDEMSKGLVTFDMVRAAFERATGTGGKFNQMTEKIAQTSYGAWEQLKGKLLGALLNIYEIIQPYLIPAINILGKGLDLVAKGAKWVADNFQTILAVAGPLTAAIVAYNVATKIGTLVTSGFVAILKVLNFVMNLNPVGLIVAGIAALTAAIGSRESSAASASWARPSASSSRETSRAPGNPRRAAARCSSASTRRRTPCRARGIWRRAGTTTTRTTSRPSAASRRRRRASAPRTPPAASPLPARSPRLLVPAEPPDPERDLSRRTSPPAAPATPPSSSTSPSSSTTST